MTDEKPDLKQVKKQKYKLFKKFINVLFNILYNVGLFITIFIVLFIIFGIIFLPHHSTREYPPVNPASSLLQSLQSGAVIYVAQERIPPNVFSDFVELKGPITGSHTLSLEYIDAEPELINPKEMKLIFNDYGTAIYYLNGSDVTASFDLPKFDKKLKEWQKDLERQQSSENERVIFFLIIVIVLTLLIFLWMRTTYRIVDIIMKSIMFLIILWFISIVIRYRFRF